MQTKTTVSSVDLTLSNCDIIIVVSKNDRSLTSFYAASEPALHWPPETYSYAIHATLPSTEAGFICWAHVYHHSSSQILPSPSSTGAHNASCKPLRIASGVPAFDLSVGLLWGSSVDFQPQSVRFHRNRSSDQRSD